MEIGLYFSQVFVVFSILIPLYVFSLVFYRLYIHPLKNFPGPIHLAAFDFFHSYKNLIQGEWYKYMLAVHEQYGPIVRVGPNHLAVDGSIGWQDIYGHKRAGRQEFSRVVEYFDPAREGVQNVFTADRENHRRHRRIMAHAFSEAAMYEQEPLIKSYVDLLISRLSEHAAANQPVDAVQWFNFTTFDIIGDLAFADSFNCLNSSKMHPWVSMIFEGIKAGSFIRFFYQYPIFAIPIRLMYGKTMLEKRLQHKALAVEKTKKRLALGPAAYDRKDFLTYMLKHNDQKGLKEAEILDNSDTLIVAGSETTATALSGLVYYLTQTPDAMKRLVNEIRSTFAAENEITMRATAALPYLHACIEEGLRCYPPATETPPRWSPGDYVHGEYIPKGTRVSIYQWATHHSSRNFVEPFAFRPERWLPSTHPYYDHAFDSDNKKAFSPFSAGPRNCIGRNLAYSELRLIASRLIWNFDINLVQGYENWLEKHKVYVIWEKTPLMVQLSRVVRESAEEVSSPELL